MNKYTPGKIDIKFIEQHESCGCCGEPFDAEDKSRIVECVNACEGIENPAAIKELIEAQKAMFEWVDKFPGVDGPEAERVKKALAALGVK